MISTNVYLSDDVKQYRFLSLALLKSLAFLPMSGTWKMIILDTHIWFWWNQDSPQLTDFQKDVIENSREDEIGISSISLIEISRLVDQGRLILPKLLDEWFSIALAEEGVLLIPITPAIAIELYSFLLRFSRFLSK